MGNYTMFGRFENPRRGMQARNLTKNVPKSLDLKSSSEQIFSKNCRWVPLLKAMQAAQKPLLAGYNLKKVDYPQDIINLPAFYTLNSFFLDQKHVNYLSW